MSSAQSLKSSASTRSAESKRDQAIAACARPLLFGEIAPATQGNHILPGRRTRSNVTFSTNHRFVKFWVMDKIRNTFLSLLDKDELKKLRFVCLDFSGKVEPHLFRHLSVTFNSKTFSNVARMTNLAMIGRHVESFTFNMPHTPRTALPPLIDTETGDELPVIYSPKSHSKEPLPPAERDEQFGSQKVAKLVAEQYPPLFHAATNVPAFIKAFSALPNLRHVKINCPRKDRPKSHRRNIVDYTLISLRIALEQAPLGLLDAVSIISLHEEGLLYLQPDAFASTPRSRKRWLGIKHLNMRMQNNEACDVKKLSSLKLLHCYLQHFSGLRTFRFQWHGEKGPFPLSLHNEPRLMPVAATSTNPIQVPQLRRLSLPTLCRFTVQNCVVDASQIGDFTMRHRRQWREFDFEGIELRSGTWDDALAPMAQWAESTKRRQRKPQAEPEGEEVPLLFCDDPLRPSRSIPYEEIREQISLEFSSDAGMRPSPLRPAKKQKSSHAPSSHRPVTPPKQTSQPSTANSSFNASVFDAPSQSITADTSFSSAYGEPHSESPPRTPQSQLRSRQTSNETYCTTATSHSRRCPQTHLFTPTTAVADFGACPSTPCQEPTKVSLEIHPCLRPRPSVRAQDHAGDVSELLMPRCYRRAPSHHSGASKAIAKAKQRLSDASGHFKKLVRLSAFDWQ